MTLKIDHPLDPLNEEEIKSAVDILKADKGYDKTSTFSSAILVEPEKTVVQDFNEGSSFPRNVRLLGIDSHQDGGFCAEIDVLAKKVVSLERLPGNAQVPYAMGDFATAMMLTTENAEYQEALKKRGITDLELVQIDPWPAGGFTHESIKPGHRAFKCISFLKESLEDNAYARPIQGVIAWVDLTLGEVVHVEDHGVIPMPTEHARYDAGSQPNLREGLKPIDINQPEGSSFEVDGYQISWQGWKFRISIHDVEGLVLHQLSLHDRPILYRAALSDMVVPYGDSDPMHSWKHVFDGSEYSLGRFINSLTLGCDCLGEIYYFDINQISWDGEATKIEQAICLHEEDYGIQWKHTDGQGGANEVRRSRRLVISSMFTVGNYDYGFFWYLYLDGTVQMEVKLTGIMGISAITDETYNPSQAPKVAKNIAAPLHQHLFCFRLDWELDGGNNQLFESEIELLPINENNPNGTQFQSISRHLKRESEAKRDVSPQSSRIWKVVNPNKENSLGIPVAYKLMPGATPKLLSHPESVVSKRAAFAKHNLWATPYESEEQTAAGPYTVMHEGQSGLEVYTSKDRDISECDLVMWHTFGLNHVPRPEDWPVMPVEYCGFHLIPVGFFDKNPTLDIPPSCDKNDES